MSNLSTSDERFLDAQEIESLLAQEGLIQRPSVKAHLEALAQKIRRDANAIRRLEDSQAKASASSADPVQPKEQDQSMTDANSAELPSAAQGQSEASVPATVVSAATISSIAAPPTLSSSSVKYKTIDKFSFDSGSYNSPTVTIYIPLPSIGSHPESNIRCNFTKSSFDVTILDLNGANYRLLKDNLEHDIVPEESKMKIKANKIILKLQKVKSDYGMYDTWNELTSKKAKTQSDKNKDPAASIMELMKDMYDQGDDNMKKMIGETMLKQREGRLDSSLDKGMDDLKF
jgi:calcyclin binding protein